MDTAQDYVEKFAPAISELLLSVVRLVETPADGGGMAMTRLNTASVLSAQLQILLNATSTAKARKEARGWLDGAYGMIVEMARENHKRASKPSTVRAKCNAFLAEWLENAGHNVPDCKEVSDDQTLEDIVFTLRLTADDLQDLADQIEAADNSEKKLAARWDKQLEERAANVKRLEADRAASPKKAPTEKARKKVTKAKK